MVLIFNDIAGSEVLLILVFILIFFGSKSIPTLARTLGKTIRQIKEASSDIQNEIKKSGGDIKKDLNLTGILQDTAEDIKRPLDQMAVDLDNSIKYQPNIKSKVQLPPTSEEMKMREEEALKETNLDANPEIQPEDKSETPKEPTKTNEGE
jgi:sec-independent protein translocase protein TatA